MKELKLFEDFEVFTKNRPTITEAQKEEFFSKFAKEIENSGDDLEDIIEDVKTVFNEFDDAYKLGKDFEKLGYDVDMEFCGLIEHKQDEYSKIIRDNVYTWINAHNIQPKFKKGDVVKFKQSAFPHFRKGEVVTLSAISTLQATYYVKNMHIEYELIEEKVELV